MAKKGLREWVQEKWVDIGAPKKKGQKASAVRRKRAAGNPGGKPTNVATFAKRKKAMYGGMIDMTRMRNV